MTMDTATKETPAGIVEAPIETKIEDGKDWSMGNTFFKYYLGAILFSYLFIALLSWNWRLPEDSRELFLFMHSWTAPFVIGVFVCGIKCLEYQADGHRREMTLCFWGTVVFEFCWGIGCHYLQPYMGVCTWFGNDVVWLGSAVAFLIGTLMVVGYGVKKVFF